MPHHLQYRKAAVDAASEDYRQRLRRAIAWLSKPATVWPHGDKAALIAAMRQSLSCPYPSDQF